MSNRMCFTRRTSNLFTSSVVFQSEKNLCVGRQERWLRVIRKVPIVHSDFCHVLQGKKQNPFGDGQDERSYVIRQASAGNTITSICFFMSYINGQWKVSILLHFSSCFRCHFNDFLLCYWLQHNTVEGGLLSELFVKILCCKNPARTLDSHYIKSLQRQVQPRICESTMAGAPEMIGLLSSDTH